MGNEDIEIDTPELYHTDRMIRYLMDLHEKHQWYVSPEEIEEIKKKSRKVYE